LKSEEVGWSRIFLETGLETSYEIASMSSDKNYKTGKYFEEFNSEADADVAALEEAEKKKTSEFADLLAESFKKPSKKLAVGDKIRGEILVVGKEEIFVSTGGSGMNSDGVVPRRDLLDAEGNFHHKVGDTLELYVTQVRGSSLFLSPKPTSKNIAEDLEDAFDMMLPVEGRVAEVCKGGVRVSIRGKMAFCPISQLDSARVESADEYIGRKMEFRITQFSEGGRNIVVSHRKFLDEQRQLSEGAFAEERQVGDIVPGKVKRIETFGAFVEVAPGIDGLLHISELSWSRVAHPQEVVQVGQDVRVKILKKESIEGRLKLSLSLKQVGPEPWEGLSSQLKEGQIVPGKVTRCVKFGAFVELMPGVEGLIPLAEMSHVKRVVRSDEFVKEGEMVTVMIKEIHPDTKRISLSLRAAGEDPWSMVAHKYPVGTVVTGKVERREAYGLFIQIEDGITGLLPKSKALEQPEFPFEKLKVGEMATVQIGELRLQERRISLTPPKDPNQDDWKGYVAQGSGNSSFGTLADQLKKALDKKKK
jgi:small subunit ribosomal protein S1